jgi:hypothetical protein
MKRGRSRTTAAPRGAHDPWRLWRIQTFCAALSEWVAQQRKLTHEKIADRKKWTHEKIAERMNDLLAERGEHTTVPPGHAVPSPIIYDNKWVGRALRGDVRNLGEHEMDLLMEACGCDPEKRTYLQMLLNCYQPMLQLEQITPTRVLVQSITPTLVEQIEQEIQKLIGPLWTIFASLPKGTQDMIIITAAHAIVGTIFEDMMQQPQYRAARDSFPFGPFGPSAGGR